MTHLQKYWWVYLILGIVIYFLLNFSMGGDSVWENWMNRLSNRGKQPLQVKGVLTSLYPKPIDGKCPEGYSFLQPQCAVAPCPGLCTPILTT